jgi:glycosyltransferase involved in cell wall biosynthesis
MNILFITDTDISPFSGGVERFTHNLSREFMNRNVNCYLAYFKPWHNENTTDFKDKIQLSINTLSDDLAAYIAKNKIDFVLIQLSKKANISVLMPIIYRVTRVSENCKVIYGFYNMPGFELVGIDINLAIYRIYHGQNLKENLNGMMIRIFTKLHLDSIPKIFVANKLKKGLYSDLIFLLSPQYIPIYKNFIGNRNLIKFEAIGNPLSYPQNIPQSEISKKEKVVINVSRYCDSHKRQSLALKIWKIIESNPNCKEWKLLMIGYGEDENI